MKLVPLWHEDVNVLRIACETEMDMNYKEESG